MKRLQRFVFLILIVVVCMNGFLNTAAVFAETGTASADACCDDPSVLAGSSCGCGCGTAASQAADGCGTSSQGGMRIWFLLAFIILIVSFAFSAIFMRVAGMRRKERAKESIES